MCVNKNDPLPERSSNGRGRILSNRRWTCPSWIVDTGIGETRWECNRSLQVNLPRPIPLKLYWSVIAFLAESRRECSKHSRSNRKYKRKVRSSHAISSNARQTTINRKRNSSTSCSNPWFFRVHSFLLYLIPFYQYPTHRSLSIELLNTDYSDEARSIIFDNLRQSSISE